MPTPASAANQPMSFTLTLKRSDQVGFDQYLSSVQDRTSPSYRHFLTQLQLADRFGPSQSEYDSVISWLDAQGMNVVQGSTNRLTITVKGTRAQAEKVFGTPIGSYQIQGRDAYANTSAPMLPLPIAADVQAISGLSDLAQPASPTQPAQPGKASQPGKVTVRCYNSVEVMNGVAPPGTCNVTLMNTKTGAAYSFDVQIGVKGCGDLVQSIIKNAAKVATGLGAAEALFIGPEALALGLLTCILAESGALNQIPGGTVTFGGDPPQKIGLLEFDSYHTSDVADWLHLVGLGASELGRVSEVPVNGGVASPGASESEVLLDIDTALFMTLETNPDVVVYDAPTSTSFEQMFNAMINDGDTVISNSWAQCEDETSQAEADAVDSVLAQAAASGISVFNGTGDTGSTCLDGSPNTVAVPADSPNATAVGGSTYVPGPGDTYGAEGWWDGTNDDPPTGQGGFGVSQYFARPSYQNGLTTASGRSVPDVVAMADPAEGVEVCEADAGGCPDGLSYGGTSMATPEWAAIAANLNAQFGGAIGNVNDALYPLANTPAFHSASDMGSDFAHVGLGDDNYFQLVEELAHYVPGTVSNTVSDVMTVGTAGSEDTDVPADGTTLGSVRVALLDSGGFPISGKAVSLSANGCSSPVISPPSGASDDSGSVVFTVTDTVPETCTFTATDTTDGATLSAQPTLTFVPPSATGASIQASPPSIPDDGATATTVTVYLENGLGQPASGKTVTLSETGSATIYPAGSTTPSETAVTDSHGNATFTATDTNAENVQFSAVDSTDGNLPVPGSASVTFYSGSPPTCTSPPVAASGYSISNFASGFGVDPYDQILPGNFNVNGCDGLDGMAFDPNGNLYVSDFYTGTINVLPPGGGTPSAANQLPDTALGPDDITSMAFGKDGELYATLWLPPPSGVNNNEDPEVVQLDPSTGATVRVVAQGTPSVPASQRLPVLSPSPRGGSPDRQPFRFRFV